MKQISTLLLALAFVATCLLPARSAPRTVEKKSVKTELSTKIEKTFVINHEIKAAVTVQCTESKFNPLAISELNRPPGDVYAKANDARFKLYNRAALPDRYKNWRFSNIDPPNLGRTI